MPRVNLILPDATRAIERGLIGVIESIALNRAGPGGRIRAIIATGAHTPPEPEAERRRLGLMAATEIHVHDADAPHVQIGPYGYDPALLDADLNIIAGPISYHYLAGFGGGRKLIAPGCCDRRSINALHRTSYNEDCSAPAEGTGMGRLSGNPFHAALTAACDKIAVERIGISIVGAEIFSGDLHEIHRKSCDYYREQRFILVPRRGRRVLVSVPHDTDLYQAHKALVAAAIVTEEGGSITLDAECPDGLGPAGFADGLRYASIDEHAAALRREFAVSRATALSLRRLAKRFRIGITSTRLDFTALVGVGIAPVAVSGEYDVTLPDGAAKLPIVSG